MSNLYISQQGVVACGKKGHGGFYLERLLENDERVGKKRDEYTTPLDHWLRVLPEQETVASCEFCDEEEKNDG